MRIPDLPLAQQIGCSRSPKHSITPLVVQPQSTSLHVACQSNLLGPPSNIRLRVLAGRGRLSQLSLPHLSPTGEAPVGAGSKHTSLLPASKPIAAHACPGYVAPVPLFHGYACDPTLGAWCMLHNLPIYPISPVVLPSMEEETQKP